MQDRCGFVQDSGNTTHGTGVVEAKVAPIDPLEQSLKYDCDWRVLITQFLPSSDQKRFKSVVYLTWNAIGEILKELSKSKNPKVRFISTDLIDYLEVHKMIRATEAVEIYAREINNEQTLELFLKARIYSCFYEKGSALSEALYFAPHFGNEISKEHPGVHAGISYVARINQVEVAGSSKDFLDITRSIYGKAWCRNHAELLKTVKGYKWEKKQRIFLYMGEPHLVFNPPIHKDNLQKGKGFLSKRFFTFDELFSAWKTKL